MTTDVETAGAAPLSMQDAMGILAQRRQAQAEPVPEAPEEVAPEPDEETESEAVPAAEDAPDPDEEPAIEGEETDEPESDPEQPAIAAPKSWDAKERAAFMRAPRDVQETILARETERDAAVSRALNEASVARGQAEAQAQARVQAEVAKVAELHTTLSSVVTEAKAAFAGKWDNVDWVAFARQDPSAYTIAKAEYDADLAALQRTHQAEQLALIARQEADNAAIQNRRQTEAARLPTLAPALADPKEGPARIAKLERFLIGLGVPQEALPDVTALQASIAYDAMLYREGKAKLAPQPKAKAPPAPAPKAAAPSAAPQRPSRQRTGEAAMTRLKTSGRLDDALAVLKARRGN